MFCFPRHRERVPALGNHPGTRRLTRLAAGPGPGFCAYRHWASRTRAVSLLTGGYIYHITCPLFNEKKGTPIKV